MCFAALALGAQRHDCRQAVATAVLMMILSDIISVFESRLPLALQESWDVCGLHIGSQSQKIDGILFSYDVCLEVVEAAVKKKCQLIICHHPLRLKSEVAINLDDYEGRLISALIKNDIAVYVCHTNHDNSPDSLNFKALCALGCTDINALIPTPVHDYARITAHSPAGSGAVGNLVHPVTLDDLAKWTKNYFNVTSVRLTRTKAALVHRPAICTGSGSALLQAAITQKADALITGDIKYHTGVQAKRQDIALIDPGHFASEIKAPKALMEIARELLDDRVEMHSYDSLQDVFELV